MIAMQCDVTMRHLGPVDITRFKAVLEQQPETLWDADADFRKRLAPERKVRTIYLLMTIGSPYHPTSAMSGWEGLAEAFEPIAARIATFYKPGRVVNAQIALLGPGDDITPHRDIGRVLEATHRVHVPLETHPDVRFLVDGIDHKLAVGEAYELDNMRPHSVHNDSTVRRIHIIVDYFEDPMMAQGA
jgi:Aspartyl/Asparaginyl beta-hydroxylase